MAFVTWLRALSALGTVAEATRALRDARGRAGPPAPTPATAPATTDAVSGLETRLANVVVAALREAFERDRARFDLERDVQAGEQARREQALRLEWLRQTGTHALSQIRGVAGLALLVWLSSVVAAVWIGELSATPKVLIGLGWLALVATVGMAVVAQHRLTAWLAQRGLEAASADEPSTEERLDVDHLPPAAGVSFLPWLFVTGLLFTACGVLVEL